MGREQFFSATAISFVFSVKTREISHGGEGEEIDVADLAEVMLRLQAQGCHNINFVTPSHQVPMILRRSAPGHCRWFACPSGL